MKQMVNIILGSGSPRRKELLKQIKLEFTVITSQAEEVIKQEESNLPAHIVRTLAKQKSMDILANFPTNFDHKNKPTIIICADTIVCMDQIKMGKPRDEADAVEILMRLSGRNHQVYTGVNCIYLDVNQKFVEEKTIQFEEKTQVYMRPFTKEEAEKYVLTNEPMDKAGAYGIQGIGACLVEKIDGDYNNVVGFPLSSFVQIGCKNGYFSL